MEEAQGRDSFSPSFLFFPVSFFLSSFLDANLRVEEWKFCETLQDYVYVFFMTVLFARNVDLRI